MQPYGTPILLLIFCGFLGVPYTRDPDICKERFLCRLQISVLKTWAVQAGVKKTEEAEKLYIF